MIIDVRVKLHSKQPSQVSIEPDGSSLVCVHEPPQDGKANQAVIILLAKYYKVSKSKVQLVSGYTAKQKQFSIDI